MFKMYIWPIVRMGTAMAVIAHRHSFFSLITVIIKRLVSSSNVSHFSIVLFKLLVFEIKC